MRNRRWPAFEADQGLCGSFEVLREAALLFYIFAFLDVGNIIKLRSVCKSWYDAVLSPQFTRLYKPPSIPWVVIRVRTEELPGRARYLNHELDYDYDGHFDYCMKLESHVEVWRGNKLVRCELPLGPSGSHFAGLIGSNGLVCGRIMQHRESLILAVGNPITNQWRILPPAPLEPGTIMRPAQINIVMENDPATNSYCLVILSDDPSSLGIMCRYDSASAAWHSEPVQLGKPVLQGSAFLHVDDAFVAYDLCSGAWSHIADVTWPACDPERDPWENWRLGFLGCFFYKGKWMWSSVLLKDPGGEDLGLAIWEMDLEKKERSWVLVSRILGKDLIGSNWWLGCEGETDMKMVQLVGDTVFISAFYRKDSFGFWPPVAYHLESNKWETCVHEKQVKQITDDCWCLPYDMECCYVVVPSLTAEP